MNAPTGTSTTRCDFTAAERRDSSSCAYSCSVAGGFALSKRTRQKTREVTPWASTVSASPGSSFFTPRKPVRGAGTYPTVRKESTASRSGSAGTSPEARRPLISEANRNPRGVRVKYSGFIPQRSRASSSRPDRLSRIASPNIPLNASRHSSPHSSYRCTITSVSERLRKVCPFCSSSARSSQWL